MRKSNNYYSIIIACLVIGCIIYVYRYTEGFHGRRRRYMHPGPGSHPGPHPGPHPHPHPPHPHPHPHPHPPPPSRRRRWWDILTFSWVPGFGGTCKNGCSYLGNGSWGCTYPGYGANDCAFATDCRWCGNYRFY